MGFAVEKQHIQSTRTLETVWAALLNRAVMQAATGSSLNLGSIPLELETAMPVRHASSWAVNDSMRVLGMLFPPCGDGAAPIDDHAGSWEGTAEARDLQNSISLTGAPLRAAAATCMPAMQWFSAALEVPDYVEFFSQPPPQRHMLHGIALLLMAPVMALMRFTIPTIAADFYDPGIFVVSAAIAPFTAGPLFGLEFPRWLPVALMVAMTFVAVVFLAFGVRFTATLVPLPFCISLTSETSHGEFALVSFE